MTRPRRSFLPWAIALLIWIVARLAWVMLVPRGDQEGAARVTVSDLSETRMQALVVRPPQQERWRDAADAPYSDEFRSAFSYADEEAARVEVEYERVADTLRGVVRARGLKPGMAYQLKLVGLEPVAGASETANAGDLRRWSSWQLGRLGRWWCEDCGWNVLDADLAKHVDDGHSVSGYLLFDWFVADASGDAEQPFALDSSMHVLWRVGQRERGANDSPPRWYTLERHADWYPEPLAGTQEQIGVFAEWEPDRPKIGELRLPPGSYQVGLNITEESFHANLGEDRALEGGGFWAWVLQSELRLEVTSG